MGRRARLYGETAHVVRPILKLRPAGSGRGRAAARADARPAPAPHSPGLPMPIRELAAAPWRQAERLGYSTDQWEALSVPSAALRDLIALVCPGRLPAPGEPWSPATMAAMKRLMARPPGSGARRSKGPPTKLARSKLAQASPAVLFVSHCKWPLLLQPGPQ